LLFILFLNLAHNILPSPSSIVNNSEFNLNTNLKREVKNLNKFDHADDIKSINTSSTKNTSINSINAYYQENNKITNTYIQDPSINYQKIPLFKKTLKERLKNSARVLNLDNFSA
jgi:hypothetical protein